MPTAIEAHTAVLDGSKPAQRTITHAARICPLCERSLYDYAVIPARMVNEAFYTPELRRRVPLLEYARCEDCGSIWAVDQRRDRQRLLEIYASLPGEYWSSFSTETALYADVDALLARHVKGSVLYDVGCGNGDLLCGVSDRWTKHGIEPGRKAVEVCRRAGLDVVEGTPSTLALYEVCDAVTCVDVIEHTPDPRAELRAMADMLRPHGCLLIYTGDAGRWTARAAGSFWEYLHCVGHVSVLSRVALQRMLRDCGLAIVHRESVHHRYGSALPVWLWQLARNYGRRLLHRRYRRMRYCHDHQLVVAKKP